MCFSIVGSGALSIMGLSRQLVVGYEVLAKPSAVGYCISGSRKFA